MRKTETELGCPFEEVKASLQTQCQDLEGMYPYLMVKKEKF
jgi:hypothetical protein